MGALEIVGALFMAVGCAFALTGSVGVLRMPDFYSRLHPAGKSDTLAQGLILLGLALFAAQQLVETLTAEGAHGHGDEWFAVAIIIAKLMLLTALLFLTAPTATHAIAKAARLDRYTRIPVAGDASQSTVAEIVVVGDIDGKLEEAPARVLDVHESDADGDGKPDAPARPRPDPGPETPSEDDDA